MMVMNFFFVVFLFPPFDEATHAVIVRKAGPSRRLIYRSVSPRIRMAKHRRTPTTSARSSTSRGAVPASAVSPD